MYLQYNLKGEAYIDWFIDNPSDEKLKARFFRLQKAYKKLKGEK